MILLQIQASPEGCSWVITTKSHKNAKMAKLALTSNSENNHVEAVIGVLHLSAVTKDKQIFGVTENIRRSK